MKSHSMCSFVCFYCSIFLQTLDIVSPFTLWLFLWVCSGTLLCFKLIFPWWLKIIGHFNIHFFVKCLFKSLCIFHRAADFFLLNIMCFSLLPFSFYIVFWTLVLCWLYMWQVPSPPLQLVSSLSQWCILTNRSS